MECLHLKSSSINNNFTEDISDSDFYKKYYLLLKKNNNYIFYKIYIFIKNNQLFIYKIHNEKKILLKIINISANTNSNYNYYNNNIKIDSKWNSISIPCGNHLYIYNLRELLENNINNFNEISFYKINNNFCESIVHKFDFYNLFVYESKVIKVYYTKNKNIIRIESLNKNNKLSKINSYLNNPVDNMIISNNGKYILLMYYKINKLYIHNLDSEKEDKFKVNINSKKQVSDNTKWLISDCGNILINKLEDQINVLLLNKKSLKIYSKNFFDIQNSSISIIEHTFNNLIFNNIVIHNYKNKFYKVISIFNDNNIFIVNNEIIYKYDISDNFKELTTNGKLFMFKNKDKIQINNLEYIYSLEYIKYKIDLLLVLFKNNYKNKVLNNIIFGNNTTRKIINITEENNVRYILDNIINGDNILFNTFENLDIPILSNIKENTILVLNNSDSIDIFFMILFNINIIHTIYSIINKDELKKIKLDIFLNIFIDINEYLLGLCSENFQKEYFEFLLLYCITLYINYFDFNIINFELITRVNKLININQKINYNLIR